MISCPECGTKISSKATACPFCGFLLKSRALIPLSRSAKPSVVAFDTETLAAEYDGLFPISAELTSSLSRIFSDVEILSRAAPAFFQTIQSLSPKTIKIADIKPALEKMINSKKLRFVTDRNGEILPSLYDKNGIRTQIRLKDMHLTTELIPSLNSIQMQLAMAQVIHMLREVQTEIQMLESGLHADRLALANSAWAQLKQAQLISDGRLRQEKLLFITSAASDAIHTLMHEYRSGIQFFLDRAQQGIPAKFFDSEGHKTGGERAVRLLESLHMILMSAITQSTAYSLLDEQNAALFALDEVRCFLLSVQADDREVLLLINSFAKTDCSHMLDKLSDITCQINNLLPLTKEMEVLPDANMQKMR